MWRLFHQSYLFVALCGGIVAGIIIAALIFHDQQIFGLAYWIIAGAVIFFCGLFHPNVPFLLAVFAVGVTIGVARAGGAGMSLELDAAVITRDWFAERVKSVLPIEEASLGTAYLLGAKDNLAKDFIESLRVAGLTHVVVASGTHLSIFIDAARKLFGKISRRAGLVFALVFIFGFMAIVGFSPSILRAGLVSILSLVAWYSGRKFAPWRIILIAATITLLINPGFLTNVGWQLSFASFGGIMVVGPILSHYYFGRDGPGLLGKTILATAAATLMTAPISLYHFGSLSLIAFAANLIILPTLPYVMGITFAAGVLGLPIINTAAEFCLKFHIAVINFFGEQRTFLIETPPRDLKILLLYIPILIYLLWIRQKQIKMVKLDKINWRKHVRTQ